MVETNPEEGDFLTKSISSPCHSGAATPTRENGFDLEWRQVQIRQKEKGGNMRIWHAWWEGSEQPQREVRHNSQEAGQGTAGAPVGREQQQQHKTGNKGPDRTPFQK